MAKKNIHEKDEPTVCCVLGVGLDGKDGQTRVTRTEGMELLGGSRETHERMQATAIRFSEALGKRGRRLPDVSARAAMDLLREAHERAA